MKDKRIGLTCCLSPSSPIIILCNNQSINQSITVFFVNYGYNPKLSLEIPSLDRPHRADVRVKDINENIKFFKGKFRIS